MTRGTTSTTKETIATSGETTTIAMMITMIRMLRKVDTHPPNREKDKEEYKEGASPPPGHTDVALQRIIKTRGGRRHLHIYKKERQNNDILAGYKSRDKMTAARK